jgi:hypothetical protein
LHFVKQTARASACDKCPFCGKKARKQANKTPWENKETLCAFDLSCAAIQKFPPISLGGNFPLL